MTAQNEQVGPKMHSAVKCAAGKVYSSKNALATTVGPNGSSKYGQRIVNRCVGKKLLKVHPSHAQSNPHGLGAVVLTDKGAKYLNEHTDKELDPDNYINASVSRHELRKGADA